MLTHSHPVRPDLVYQCIIFAICSVFQMRIVEFAEMLQGSINEKIKECKGSMHVAHNPIYNDSLEVEIEALQWVQGQIQHLVINNERKDTKIRIDK
jgi:hypothetical protein